MTPETYCPECKQNVPHEEGQSCPNCSYEFEVFIPRAELEELVEAIEALVKADTDYFVQTREGSKVRSVFNGTAEKFRAKYLEGTK